jgi:antitoxin CptB
MQTLIDERALSKLRWRCRRGLLENDLFIERFFASRQDGITTHQAAGLGALMDLADNDLLDLLLRRTEPEGELQRDDVNEVLALMRATTSTRDGRRAEASPHGGDKPAPATHPQREESP